MDPNTNLLLVKTEQPARWEDEEKACYGVAELRAEFRKRLYRVQDELHPGAPEKASVR